MNYRKMLKQTIPSSQVWLSGMEKLSIIDGRNWQRQWENTAKSKAQREDVDSWMIESCFRNDLYWTYDTGRITLSKNV